MGNSQEWEREIYFKHQNISNYGNIDFSVFAFSSGNGVAIPGKPAYEMCFRYPVKCHAIVKCFENDIKVWKAVDPY